MTHDRTRKFFLNTVILTAFSLTSNLIGTGFHIYLSNQLGAEGTGLLQLVLSVYYMSTNLAVGGIHYAVTRFVTEAFAANRSRQIRPLMTRCLTISLGFGCLTTGIIFFCAPLIGTYWLCDVRTIRSLRMISLGLPFFAVACSLRSFFLTLRNTWNPISGQLSEQLSYLAATWFFLRLLLPKGLSYACCSAALGMTVSEIAGCIVTYLLYRHDVRKKFLPPERHHLPSVRTILSFSLPISLGSTLRTALTSVENVLIPGGLKKYGLSYRDSLSAYGAIKGMVLPTLTFPNAFIASFSMMLVPEIAEAHAKNDPVTIRKLTHRVIWGVLLFSLFTAVVFFTFSEDIAELFFHGQSLGRYFRLLCPLLPFLYLDGIVDAILKGMNQQLYGLKVNVADASLRILLLIFLLPKYGIAGYLVVVTVSTLFNSSLSIGRLLILTRLRPRPLRWLVFPLGAALLTCFAGEKLAALGHLSSLPGKIIPCLCLYLLFLPLIARDFFRKHIPE